jgi:TorA-specific chaperone
MPASHAVTPDDPNLPDYLDERFLAYTFLSIAYREELTGDFLKTLQETPPDVAGALGDFVVTLSDAAVDLEQIRIDLAADYAALFLNMSAHPVPPFESVYTSEKGLLMQDAYHQILSEYARSGLKREDDFTLPEDHLALEFEFMAFLIKRTRAAFTANDSALTQDLFEQQRNFFETHLQNWVYRFCDDVEARAKTPFYRALASFTRDCLDQERDFFAR